MVLPMGIGPVCGKVAGRRTWLCRVIFRVALGWIALWTRIGFAGPVLVASPGKVQLPLPSYMPGCPPTVQGDPAGPLPPARAGLMVRVVVAKIAARMISIRFNVSSLGTPIVTVTTR
jgi:hypothetical protein